MEQEKLNPLALNKEQLETIDKIEGNFLIVASAGTGKTTTIVERYINLIEKHNYHPSEVLMTTFTNKAAKDMLRKISARTDRIPHYIGTMHSLFLKMLRTNSSLVLPNPNFTIIDEPDKKRILKSILQESQLDSSSVIVKYFLAWIGKFKDVGVSADTLKIDNNLEIHSGVEKIEIMLDDEVISIDPKFRKLVPLIYKKYDEFLRQLNLIDLDDILLLTYKLFEKHPKIRERYANQFRSIMVDEAQDLNVVQMKILDLLDRNNICLIGDDCQNIYEWRGSSNDLVFRFNDKYEKVILKDNYRSTENIISAVNKTINSMRFKIDKELVCTRGKGSKIAIIPHYSREDEIAFLVSQVKNLIKNNVPLNEIAILFRTNNIGKQIEREFRKSKIPCHLSKSRDFFEREEVKDILSFLKFKMNLKSMLDFERVLLLIEGIGKVKLKNIFETAKDKKISFLDSLELLNFSEQSKEEISKLNEILKDFEKNPIDLFLTKFGYELKLSRKYKQDPEKFDDKLENIQVLKELFGEGKGTSENIQKFLDSLIETERKEKDNNKVTLSTIHSAKGLEWKQVFLACCNEQILPFYRENLTILERDSELRLFYVAISRAKDNLVITFSEHADWKELSPSQFLDLI